MDDYRRLALGRQFLRRRVVAIGRSTPQQGGDRFLVTGQPRGLEIWSIRPANLRSLVPFQPEPSEAVKNRLQRLRHIPLLVGIVDSQQELAAMLPREKPIEKRGPHSADMQIAGRTGSESSANRPGNRVHEPVIQDNRTDQGEDHHG